MVTVVINGHTYSDDSDPATGMGNGGHRTRFIPALSDVVVVAGQVQTNANNAATSASNASTSASNAAASAVTAVNAPGTNATSTTSLSITEASKTLTIQTGKSIVVGMSMKIASTASPTNWMLGDVTAYNSGTGSLTVSVSIKNGTGTFAAWTVSLTAPATGGGTLNTSLNYAVPVSIASATSVAIGAAASNIITITGSTTINSFDTIAAGAERELTFSAALTLTHNATSMILLGGVSINVEAGSIGRFLSLGSGNWKMTSLVKSSGEPLYESNRSSWQNRILATSTGSLVVPAGIYLVRVYAVGKGGDGSLGTTVAYGAGGGGGGMAYGEFAVVPGQSISYTIAAGSTTVVYAATTMLTGNAGTAASGVTAGTGGTASKHASVTNGNAFSGASGGATCGGGGSAGSPLGAGYAGGNGSTDAGGGGGGIGGFGGGGGSTGSGGGGGAGGNGFSGTASNGGGGGGAGGEAYGILGGIGRSRNALFTDPILAAMVGGGGSVSVNGGVGGGGGGVTGIPTALKAQAGNGGDGGGGGGSTRSSTASIETKGGYGGILGGGGGSGSATVSGALSRAGYGGLGGGGGGTGILATGSTGFTGFGGGGFVEIFY